MKLLILAPYPFGQAPSQRFRFELFIKSMEEKGWIVDFQSFLSMSGWNSIYKHGYLIKKILAFVSGFLMRILILFRLRPYDFILIHRELTPFGPPIFEWIIAKILRKRIIYDFDDAIWLTDLENEGKLWTWLKWRSKVATICKWSWKVSVGNQYLADFASQYCNQVDILPTVVDTALHKPISPKPKTQDPKPIIGWTGSHSTLFYLNSIIPILKELEAEYEFEFVVIANRDPKFDLKNYRFVAWDKEKEVEDLAQFDIGIMPLEESEWAKGKCGFKLIQYLALEIPGVASPVGVNTSIIQDGQNGFLAATEGEWVEKLTLLIEDPSLRKRRGEAGRTTVETHFSVRSNTAKFLDLFE